MDDAMLACDDVILCVVLASTFDLEPKDEEVTVGGDVRLSCHVQATPPAVISWEKDGEPVTSDDR